MTTSSRSRPGTPIGAWHPPDLATVAGALDEPVAPSPDEEARRIVWLEGHAAAMAERDAQGAEAIEACQAAVRGMRQAVTQLRAQVSSTVYALSVAIARHLVEREVTQDPLVVQQLVGRALNLAPMSGAVTVRMNPADIAALQAMDAMPQAAGLGIELRWVADDTVRRGGCLVESPAAIIDGRIDRALLDIYEQISHD